MEELLKRPRLTKESTIHDIASSIREISQSVSDISGKYRTLLKVNKALVLYMQNDKKRQQISALNDIQSDLEQTRLASD